jgi:DNA-directed RNA polymerase beta' subunit
LPPAPNKSSDVFVFALDFNGLGMVLHVLRAGRVAAESICLTMPRMNLKSDRSGRAHP